MASKDTHSEIDLPLLTLRDTVVFPLVKVPLLIGRKTSLLAVKQGLSADDSSILIVAQKNMHVDVPTVKDVHTVGVKAKIVENDWLPDRSLSMIVEASHTVKLKDINRDEERGLFASFEILSTTIDESTELLALQRTLLEQFSEYIQLMGRSLEDVSLDVLRGKDAPEWITNFIVTFIDISVEDKQELLEEISLQKRMHMASLRIQKEIDILRMQNKIMGDVRNQIDKSQKEYILHEQMKAISKELGEKATFVHDENQELQDLLEKTKLPKDVKTYIEKEIHKLGAMMPHLPEAATIRHHVELILSLPWFDSSEEQLDMTKAFEILEKGHYGLQDPKDRILEYIAVSKLVPKGRGTVLCLVGAPGVGKTSLAKSMAEAMARCFVRIPLGGVRDEADIRGHRKTYVGAMPSKIIQALKKCGKNNPLILLDEIDKMGHDFQGDPAAALLEVLDPEQNEQFQDHYLGLGFDLSNVIFVATANNEYDIPYALHDRMEMIRLEGYTEQDKLKIAEKFLIVNQIKNNGLEKDNKADHKCPSVIFHEETLLQIIREYTREAGVRELDRMLAKISRKIAKKFVQGELKRKRKLHIRNKDLVDYLGVPSFFYSKTAKKGSIGVVMGLAWTSAGGDVLPIEATKMKGKNRLILTGHLGEVMQESGQAALSYLRTHAEYLDLDPNFYDNYELHIHAPEGAIPKDGPSAGITLACALYSVLSEKVMPSDIAMTGEITLTGKVLKIGGLKSKLLAAKRSKIAKVIMPEENKKNYEEIPAELKKDLQVHFVSHVREVLDICFQRKMN
ncbi:endopeptidase La [PVC group bacterium (ex Bugula neritina AB1)]|nr:endopeptidase La [PVC group bacterium (ex Bugula neritina AB1)]